MMGVGLAISLALMFEPGAPGPDLIYSPATPPLAAPQPTDLQEPAPPDPAEDPSNAIDPNMYADSVDTDVTYDNSVAQSYDDGYDPQAYAQFADSLAPYGSWVDDAAYGRVWTPSSSVVGADFAPYATNGHWVLTEYGWTWVSAWDWGWAPFHYGRWAMLSARGWCWIPGTLWGPAWVSWRWGGGYVGWAPLPPRGIQVARPIGMRSPWRFTVAAHLGAARPSYVPARVVPAVFGHTAVVSNRRLLSMGGTTVRVNAGPQQGFAGYRGGNAPPRLAVVARGAVPRVVIQPRAGVALAARPWTSAGIREQSPVHNWPSPSRWPSPGLSASQRSGASSPSLGPRLQPAIVQTRPGFTSISGGSPGWMNSPRFVPNAPQRPSFTSPPSNGGFVSATPTGGGFGARTFGTPGARPFVSTPAQERPYFRSPAGSPSFTRSPVYRPATPWQGQASVPSRSFAPAPSRGFAPAAPARTWSAPAYRSPSFSSPQRSFSAGPSFGHAGGSFMGGGMGRGHR